MKVTAEEIEEAKYELWLLSGGLEQHENLHKFLAESSLYFMRGWRVLEHKLIDDLWHEARLVEAVIRRGSEAKIIRWDAFNQGWMTPSPGGGWVQFNPAQ
jgi:hypothetical protein